MFTKAQLEKIIMVANDARLQAQENITTLKMMDDVAHSEAIISAIGAWNVRLANAQEVWNMAMDARFDLDVGLRKEGA